MSKLRRKSLPSPKPPRNFRGGLGLGRGIVRSWCGVGALQLLFFTHIISFIYLYRFRRYLEPLEIIEDTNDVLYTYIDECTLKLLQQVK